MGRRVARGEEGGESQTRQDRHGATPRPLWCSSCVSATSRIASANCSGKTSSVRTCSRSCVHTRLRESWKPSIGEQICNYADVEGYNPFRNLNGVVPRGDD